MKIAFNYFDYDSDGVITTQDVLEIMDHTKPTDWLIMEDANFLLKEINKKENNVTESIENLETKKTENPNLILKKSSNRLEKPSPLFKGHSVQTNINTSIANKELTVVDFIDFNQKPTSKLVHFPTAIYKVKTISKQSDTRSISSPMKYELSKENSTLSKNRGMIMTSIMLFRNPNKIKL